MTRKRPLSNKDIIDMQLAQIENTVRKFFVDTRKDDIYYSDRYGYKAKEYHRECITPIAELLEENINNFRELITNYIIEDLPQYQERKDIDE
jgi:hypothetical protein